MYLSTCLVVPMYVDLSTYLARPIDLPIALYMHISTYVPVRGRYTCRQIGEREFELMRKQKQAFPQSAARVLSSLNRLL